jgi:hypothetical protein
VIYVDLQYKDHVVSLKKNWTKPENLILIPGMMLIFEQISITVARVFYCVDADNYGIWAEPIQAYDGIEDAFQVAGFVKRDEE